MSTWRLQLNILSVTSYVGNCFAPWLGQAELDSLPIRKLQPSREDLKTNYSVHNTFFLKNESNKHNQSGSEYDAPVQRKGEVMWGEEHSLRPEEWLPFFFNPRGTSLLGPSAVAGLCEQVRW